MAKGVYKKHDKLIDRETTRLFWAAKWRYKWPLLATFALRIPGFSIQSIAVPFFIALGLEAIINRDFEAVPNLILIILGLTILANTLLAIGVWTISINATKAYTYLQSLVFSNFLHKDYEFYNDAYYGSLGAQATTLREAASEYGRIWTLNVVSHAITIVAGLAVIAYNAPILAVITIVCMFFILSYTMWTSQWRLKFRRQLSVKNSEISGVIGDSLTHSAAVKSFAAETYETKRLKPIMDVWKKIQFRVWLSSIPADFGRNFLAAITIALLLFMTARLYEQGSISIAIVALVQLYVIRMIATTEDIVNTIKSYETVMGNAYQPVKTMLVESTIKDRSQTVAVPKNSPRKAIKFNNINYRYPGTKQRHAAIKNFELTINKGEKIGLVGLSGSGKTTLTKLLLRFLEVDSGTVTVDTTDIRDFKQTDLRHLIAYVPQEPILFHRSIADNIGYGKPGVSRQKILAAAKTAHVNEFAAQLPNTYDTEVGERGVKLSGGQRQRVAIARALLKDAPVLVLDEATSSLDSKSEKLIQDALIKLMKNRTAIVIAHRLSTIQSMDRIVVMDKGGVVEVGTHRQLLKNRDGLYAQLWAHQSDGYLPGSLNGN